MMILSLLEQEDLYGYEISLKIEDIGGGYITIPEGSLYPTLYKLQDKGLISSYRKSAGKRLTRIYYHIEDSGIEYLNELKNEFYAVNETIHKIISYKKEYTKDDP